MLRIVIFVGLSQVSLSSGLADYRKMFRIALVSFAEFCDCLVVYVGWIEWCM